MIPGTMKNRMNNISTDTEEKIEKKIRHADSKRIDSFNFFSASCNKAKIIIKAYEDMTEAPDI